MSTVYRCSLHATRGTLQIVNTFHLAIDSAPIGPGNPTADALAEKVWGHFQFVYAAVLDTASNFDSVSTREEVHPPAIPSAGFHAGVMAGGRTTPDTDLPTPMCGLIQIKSNAAVRGGTGRNFMPPAISSTELNNSAQWKTSGNYWPQISQYALTLKAGISSGSWWTGGWTGKLIVFSPTRFKRGDANYYFDVTDCYADPRPRWLRSRVV